MEKASGSETLNQSRVHNKVNEIYHATYGSAITETTGDPWIDPVHDLAGNMILAPNPGNEVFNVRVVDEDIISDDLLHNITGVTIARPAGCFPNALIGPTSTEGTLTNPSPGGEVKGPSGASGEATAEVGYEIGPSSDNSPTVDVTAN